MKKKKLFSEFFWMAVIASTSGIFGGVVYQRYFGSCPPCAKQVISLELTEKNLAPIFGRNAQLMSKHYRMYVDLPCKEK